jgi:hypothetical protein
MSDGYRKLPPWTSGSTVPMVAVPPGIDVAGPTDDDIESSRVTTWSWRRHDS